MSFILFFKVFRHIQAKCYAKRVWKIVFFLRWCYAHWKTAGWPESIHHSFINLLQLNAIQGRRTHDLFSYCTILQDVYLVYILNELAGNSFMIFCSTCVNTMRVALMLRNLGLTAVPLHGQMSQVTRVWIHPKKQYLIKLLHHGLLSMVFLKYCQCGAKP